MAGRPPLGSLPSDSDHNSDPFADRPRALQFQEQPRPFDSTVSLPQEFGIQGRQYDDEEVEKQPLTGGNVPGGFYPPGYVYPRVQTIPLSPQFTLGLSIPTCLVTHTADPFPLPRLGPTVLTLHGVAGRLSDVVSKRRSN